MARIAGVNLPNQKRLEIGLTYIYGIGPTSARKICAALGLSPDKKIHDLTDEEVTKLQRHIDDQFQVEGDLRRERQQAIKRLTRSAPTAASATAAACQSTASARRRTRARARARRRPSAAARRRQVMAPPRKPAARGRTRRRVKKNIAIGQAHIKTSFNNTIVSLTDKDGNVIVWESAGSAGLQGLAQVDARSPRR